jgi:tripartite-type tricarboxylate transporter receptor subunit TctC
LLVRPGTPLERVKILRQAYQKALNDPELIAEAKKGRVEVRFSSGEEIEELVRKVMDQPPEVVARIKRLFV